ncbi:unnamed protein product [Tetraodon nigroviridis]|uniref:Protein tweety homolog n=1 Tax=Tetraodon nigroviridis TaxID=99883 RepID=Q4RYE1_TETNG|nr:unnamed protein product [Tetraodon nigroviridis]
MSSARGDYVAPWWTYWLHNFPHINLRFQPVDNSFQPEEENYQQSLMFLGCVAAAGLGLNLLGLAVYLSCLCCCRKDEEEEESKKPGSCCVTWSAVAAALLTCVAVGVGFYGNSETNDGVYQLTYSFYNANHTLGGVDSLVSGTMGSMRSGLHQHLARLDEIFATRGDYVQTLKFMQQMADNVIKQLLGLPDWEGATMDLATVADQTASVEYYRWLTYLLLLIADLIICLLACLGLAKQSRWLLTTMMVFGVLTLVLSWASLGADLAVAVGTSDFCVSPDRYLLSQTKGIIGTGEARRRRRRHTSVNRSVVHPLVVCLSDILHYYLYCNQTLSNPFQQPLTIFQRSLTTMQIQIQGLLQFAVPLFPTAERDLVGVQRLLNSSEASLHQLTALLDCRGLNKDYLDAMVGVCYDGVEGTLYLCLFSSLAACAFTVMLCAVPRAWRQMGCKWVPCRAAARAASQSVTSFSAPPACAENGPTTTWTRRTPSTPGGNQTALFGGTPRYENVPLIGRGSPPPSYSPTMRATYLSMTEEQRRQTGNDFQA